MRKRSPYLIAVVEKTMKVLIVMGAGKIPMTLTEIALTAEVPKNTVFRILRTLETRKWVQRAGDRWYIGVALWRLIEVDLEIKLQRLIKRRGNVSDGTGA